MSWKKTSCCLCYVNCGLEVTVEDNRIVKVRPDKDNLRSQGYACRKGLNITSHQQHDDRLTHPLKKNGDGFERISWEQAVSEIASKLKGILDKHGPRSFAYMGGGGQGSHFEAALGLPFLRSLGSRYHYSAAAQELSGEFWVNGRCLGKQHFKTMPDHDCEMILAIGWNPMASHGLPRAPVELKRFAKDPGKLLVVVDPRLSETAQIADIHLPIRPGTDALMTRAMIAIILENEWQNQEYINDHVTGLDEVRPWFEEFDAHAALKVCDLDYDQVSEVCHAFATRKSCMHSDLGILMNRHSTVTSYLEVILLAICGRLCVPGGNMLPGKMAPIGTHTDERDERTWRTAATDIPAVCGYFPPNVMPEEIMSKGADRLRAVIISSSNPLRSYADTGAYEKAFKKLDLLVCVEVAMTETAELADYVLPAKSALESWDGTFFTLTYPEVFFQMRNPVVEARGEAIESAEVFLRLADAVGLVPDTPDYLHKAARSGCGPEFRQALMEFITAEPSAMKAAPFVVAKTLGPALGSVNKAMLCAMLQMMPPAFSENAERAGFTPGASLGDELFKKIMDHPEGIWVGKCDPQNNFAALATDDHKVQVHIPELADWVVSIDAESESKDLKPDPKYPLILMAGRHYNMNANSLMRDPAWNDGRRPGTMLMHPSDADSLDMEDGQVVSVSTEAGEGTVELEVTKKARPGQVVIPHGFGLKYKGVAHGINVNQLTKNTHRDRMFATPLHRYVPCRVKAL